MKQKGSIGVVLLVVFLLIIGGAAAAGYYVFIYPRQQLNKARTPDTSLNTNTDSMFKKDEVKQSGLNTTLVVAPSENDVISGVVIVKAEDAPEVTKHVGFSIDEKFEDLGKNGPNLGFDSEGSDGWEMTLDTTEYANGEYYLAIFVFDKDASSNPLGVANAKVEIRN